MRLTLNSDPTFFLSEKLLLSEWKIYVLWIQERLYLMCHGPAMLASSHKPPDKRMKNKLTFHDANFRHVSCDSHVNACLRLMYGWIQIFYLKFSLFNIRTHRISQMHISSDYAYWLPNKLNAMRLPAPGRQSYPPLPRQPSYFAGFVITQLSL